FRLIHRQFTNSPPAQVCLTFFFTDTPPTEIYTLSLHDALPISLVILSMANCMAGRPTWRGRWFSPRAATCRAIHPRFTRHCLKEDRKSTRLNSSHLGISYAVFCLKKKKTKKQYDAEHQQHRNSP